ncbi:MAG: hypothetical protein LBB84_10870 [Tannerellaceae bacterium]|nr:hypothetical protein [Tannerellaceae bacterium]
MRNRSKFEKQERDRVMNLLINSNDIFNGDNAGKQYPTNDGLKPSPIHLLNCRNNLINGIVQDVIDYFNKNEIAFWKTDVDEDKMPTGHTLSSQIACINHLFPLRNDKDAVLAIAQTICPEIVDVMKIETDKYFPSYIAFEVVSDTDHLNETKDNQKFTRGKMCTSVDALIYAKHKDSRHIIIPIEWKYTENYHENGKPDKDYSIEDRRHEKEGKGKERLLRYSDLITNSNQLKSLDKYKNSVYFFEPFYQLMRQTLWAEQMIAGKATETIQADDFIHVHVISKENDALLNYNYPVSNNSMEETWRKCLHNQEKYKIISPKELAASIDYEKYLNLIRYLSTRYWRE